MLKIYRLHTAKCVGRDGGPRGRYDRAYRRCHCPIHVEGTIGGREVRESLRTTNWTKAQARIAEAEACDSWEQPKVQEPETVSGAKEKYLRDVEHGRKLSHVTVEKYELLLRLLEEFAFSKGIKYLKELDAQLLREFRETWKLSPRTSCKRLELMKAFFRFAYDSKWIPENSARLLKPPKVKDVPVLPFGEEEMQKIFDACRKIKLSRGKSSDDGITNDKLLTFVLLLRHSGLRIGDAAMLTIDRLSGNKLLLYTQKSGVPVYVPLPPLVADRLRELKLRHGKYLFVGPRSMDMDVASDVWRRKLALVFKEAKIASGHPHRFRHTFCVELLKKGTKLETVSILLGHSSVKITERHYASWVKDRQELLEQEVEKTWSGLSLVTKAG